MNVTFNPRQATVMTHRHAKEKNNGKGHLVQKKKWKHTDGADCITFLTNAVSKYVPYSP